MGRDLVGKQNSILVSSVILPVYVSFFILDSFNLLKFDFMLLSEYF